MIKNNKIKKDAFNMASLVKQKVPTDYKMYDEINYKNLSLTNKKERSLIATGKESISSRDVNIGSNNIYKNLSIDDNAEHAVVTGRVSELSDEQYLVQRFPGSSPGHTASSAVFLGLMNINGGLK